MWKWLRFLRRAEEAGPVQGSGGVSPGSPELRGVTRAEAGGAPAPGPSPKLRPDAIRVTIGLDYGTHSTKVVVNKELDEHGVVLVLGPAPDNSQAHHPFADAPFPWFSQPSVVGVHGDRLVFGEEARDPENDLRHFALKATLIKGDPELDQRFLRATGCETTRESMDVLAAGYLAWILGLVKQRLDEIHGERSWTPFVAVGAPMDHYDDLEVKRRYERILNASVRMAFDEGVPQRERSWRLPEAADRIRSALAEEQPPQGYRLYAVLPETVAAMVPLSRDPRWHGGLHHVIDIGGGTTEVSVIELVMDPVPTVDCRSDASRPVGGIRLRSFDLSGDGEDPAIEIYRHANTVWQEAYSLDAKNRTRRELWKSSTVLVAGGGWGTGRMQDALNRQHAAREYFRHDATFDLRFALYSPSPEVLRLAPPRDAKDRSSDSRHLLPVALGLSFYPSWPDWYKPSEADVALPDAEDIIPDDPFYGHA